MVDAVVDERTLRELYLSASNMRPSTPRRGRSAAAYNQVNGTYCCDNEYLLTTILRDEWGFDGLVISDWGATNDRVAGVRRDGPRDARQRRRLRRCRSTRGGRRATDPGAGCSVC